MEDNQTTVTLLGTNGGPRIRKDRHGPGQLIRDRGRTVVVDCGPGTVRRLSDAGVELAEIDAIYITHCHSDHNVELGTLLLLAWAGGRATPMTVFGPPPTAEMVRLQLASHQYDITIRTEDEGRPDLENLIRIVELTEPGEVPESVLPATFTRVNHPPITDAYAYRFELDGMSVTISGDTTPCSALTELARDCDILIHEAIFMPFLEEMGQRLPSATRMVDHLRESHTDAADLGGIAVEAGVRHLVLSHLVPGTDDITDEQWLERVGSPSDVVVTLGHDLLSFTPECLEHGRPLTELS
jgi:ribonuclease BN (tRNA processing enzyme)